MPKSFPAEAHDPSTGNVWRVDIVGKRYSKTGQIEEFLDADGTVYRRDPFQGLRLVKYEEAS